MALGPQNIKDVSKRVQSNSAKVSRDEIDMAKIVSEDSEEATGGSEEKKSNGKNASDYFGTSGAMQEVMRFGSRSEGVQAVSNLLKDSSSCASNTGRS